MPLTIADLEDVEMQARENWKQFVSEQDAQWMGPMRNALLGAMWNGLDDETTAQLEMMSPDAAEAMNKRYGGGANGKPLRAVSAAEEAGILQPAEAAGAAGQL